MEDDPALQFFPDGNFDLYAVLEVSSSASAEEIRKAYRRRALRLHPDKLTAAGIASEEANHQFQQLGFAYGVLSDADRRKRYDQTGRTDESLFSDEGDFNWGTYFRDLWEEVCGEKLNEFKAKYVGSDEERQEVYEAYRAGEGSLEHILNSIPFAEVLQDEERIVALVNEGIQSKDLERLEGWKNTLADTKGRETMRKKARKEASEAEAHAKELGVWDEIFGDGKKRPRPSRRDSQQSKEKNPTPAQNEEVEEVEEEEEEEAVPTKRARRAKDKSSQSQTKSKSNAPKGKKPARPAAGEENEHEDLDGLAALIQRRQSNRGGGISSLIARLEEDAHAEADARHKTRGGKGKRERRDPLASRPEPGEPTEDEFQAAQQRLLGSKTSSSSSGSGRQGKTSRTKKSNR